MDDPRDHDRPESGRRVLVDTGSRDVRTRVGELSRGRQEERSRALSAAGTDQVHLETGVPYAFPLRRAFAARARRINRA